MKFNTHPELKGLHAFLGASKYHWINYDKQKLLAAYKNFRAAERGTTLHDFAATCIRLKQRLASSKKTLNMYVNDAIGFRMTPEQILYYSPNCFGTADAICYRDNFLRIHDYKSGETKAHIEQLYIYAAIFCLEYDVDPLQINIELRIYQSDEIIIEDANKEFVKHIMDLIVSYDKLIEKSKINDGE